MVELFVLGLVAAGTYFFLKAVWKYEIRIVSEEKQ